MEGTFICEICGRPVLPSEALPGRCPDSCNAAVLGDYLPIRGHSVCINNVDNRVVIPNRIRLMAVDQRRVRARKKA